MSNFETWVEGKFGKVKLDAIGDWSMDKLNILKLYIGPYSSILAKQKGMEHVYVDAFSGAGLHIHKRTGEIVKGSPLNALELRPPFCHYYFIDKDGDKVGHLREKTAEYDNVTILEGDCNVVLTNEVLPKVRYEDFRRGVCFLDPYGLHIGWPVIATIAQMRSLEIFLNFPLMDINMNVVRDHPDQIEPLHIERMTAFWGNDEWLNLLYKPQQNLFGESRDARVNRAACVLVPAYRQKLKDSGFKYVPEPIAIKGDKGATLYYLYFAGPNYNGSKIASYLFKQYNCGRLR